MKNKVAIRRIRLKAPWEIELMRTANRIVAEILGLLMEELVEGVTTHHLDLFAEKEILRRGCKPAFKGYHGYPASLCVSINEEIVHGIPSRHRRLRQGDLVSLDLGVVYNGYYGDAAVSGIVGSKGPSVAHRLIEVTKGALEAGISKIKPRPRLGNVSAAIQVYAESAGFGVVRQFVGHGIGKALHEPPEVPNYGRKGTGPVLKPGMVIAIEPMVTAGSVDVRVLEDGWTAVTADGSLAAHFEHTVAITNKGPLILSVI